MPPLDAAATRRDVMDVKYKIAAVSCYTKYQPKLVLCSLLRQLDKNLLPRFLTAATVPRHEYIARR